MQVVPVADAPGEHHRRERDRHPVRPRHRPHRVARDEARVRERDARPGAAPTARTGRSSTRDGTASRRSPAPRAPGSGRPRRPRGRRERALYPWPLVRGDRIGLVGFAGLVLPPEEELELVGAAQLQPCARSAGPASCARTTRPHGGHVLPSWSRWSTAAIAQPGEADRATAEAGSGIRRVSPAGPSMPGPRSGCRSPGTPRRRWTGPRRTGRPPRKRRSGTTFTRVTPSGPTDGERDLPRPRRAAAAGPPSPPSARPPPRSCSGACRSSLRDSEQLRYSVRSQSLT